MLNVCISKMFSCTHHHRALQRGIYRNELYMFMYGFVDMHVWGVVSLPIMSLIIFVLTSPDKAFCVIASVPHNWMLNIKCMWTVFVSVNVSFYYFICYAILSIHPSIHPSVYPTTVTLHVCLYLVLYLCTHINCFKWFYFFLIMYFRKHIRSKVGTLSNIFYTYCNIYSVFLYCFSSEYINILKNIKLQYLKQKFRVFRLFKVYVLN